MEAVKASGMEAVKKPFRVAVVTVSDRAFSGEREDLSGPAIEKVLCDDVKFTLAERAVVPDEGKAVREVLVRLCDSGACDLVLTTGGTGCAPRDVTPEATLDVADKVVPGIAEAIRAASLEKTKFAMLSRGVAVIRGRTLIVNFAGSPKACVESIEVIMEALPHALELLRGEKPDK